MAYHLSGHLFWVRIKKAERQPISLIMVDVDFFKRYNDTHGHKKGDKLLRELVGIMRNILRPIDYVCRYGGEEFAIILSGLTRFKAVDIANRLRQAVMAHPFDGAESQPEGKVTISLGVAEFPGDADSPERLVECADAALYAAKHSGRNTVRFYTTSLMDSESQRTTKSRPE